MFYRHDGILPQMMVNVVVVVILLLMVQQQQQQYPSTTNVTSFTITTTTTPTIRIRRSTHYQQPEYNNGYRIQHNSIGIITKNIKTTTRSVLLTRRTTQLGVAPLLLFAISVSSIIDTFTTLITQQRIDPEAPIESVVIVLGSLVTIGYVVLIEPLLVPSQLISTNDLNCIIQDTYMEQQIRNGKQQQKQQKRSLQCIYKATRDGWSAIDFHNKVDNQNSGAIVVARTTSPSGITFGGYNPNGWRSTDDYYSSTTAFLWCYNNNNKKEIVKLPILPGGNCAIFDYATSGPCFGSCDVLIGPPKAAIMGGFTGPNMEDNTKSAGNLRICKSSIGSTYDSNPIWPIRGTVRLRDVEVYCIL